MQSLEEAGALIKRTYTIGIEETYRRSVLRVISAFRTVSTDTAVVITEMMPLKLVVVVERRKIIQGE